MPKNLWNRGLEIYLFWVKPTKLNIWIENSPKGWSFKILKLGSNNNRALARIPQGQSSRIRTRDCKRICSIEMPVILIYIRKRWEPNSTNNPVNQTLRYSLIIRTQLTFTKPNTLTIAWINRFSLRVITHLLTKFMVTETAKANRIQSSNRFHSAISRKIPTRWEYRIHSLNTRV